MTHSVPDPLAAFAKRACSATSKQYAAVIRGLPEARECLSAWMDAELAACSDELFARRFASYHPMLGQPWQEFVPRLVHMPDGTTLLAGIRFKGGDTNQPFVRVAAWDTATPRPSSWGDALRRTFAVFAPRHIQLRWPGERRPTPTAQIDQHHIMGLLSTLRQQARPWGEVGVDVRVATDTAFLPELVAGMARWRVEAGPRNREVFTADESDLQDALETGALLTAHQGEAWRGVTGARRGAHRWADGYEVIELFLDKPLRGARRAQVLQRRLIDALVDHGRDALWGTIHGTNRPSLRTAQRCGRRVVETSWFLPID